MNSTEIGLFFRAMINQVRDGVILVDREWNITHLNPVAETLCGVPAGDAIGKPLTAVLNGVIDQTPLTVGEMLQKFSGSAKRNSQEPLQIVSQNGQEYAIQLSITPVQNEERIFGYSIMFYDITLAQRLEEEMLKADKLESIGILAGGIAHNYNNILTGILGNVSLAKLKTAALPDVESLLEEAERALIRSRELTQQLLTFSGGGDPIKVAGSVVELIQESAMFALQGSNVRCQFDIASDLWDVLADQGQIRQVLNNLVINADQAMPNGGEIRISATNVRISDDAARSLPPGDYIRIDVADEGVGMSDEVLKKIFDPYFTTKQRGSGLGLAICYSIIKKHGGHIEVSSELNSGTTFRVYLPAATIVVAKEEHPQPSPAHKKGKILLVDDERMVLETASEMLQFLGFQVFTAEDSQTAFSLFQQACGSGEPFELVVLDLTIPGDLSGERILTKLLEIDPNVKALVSSGYSNNPIMANYLNYGFHGVVAKPYRVQELESEIRRVLSDSTEVLKMKN